MLMLPEIIQKHLHFTIYVGKIQNTKIIPNKIAKDGFVRSNEHQDLIFMTIFCLTVV